MPVTRLQQRVKTLEIAEDAVIAELKLLFPKGMMVSANIQYGQIIPSHGEVIGHEGGRFAYLVVRLDSRTKNVRRIPAENIIR
jgi:hypothetical protein